VHTAFTILTAAALLWHTLAGCCAHLPGESSCGHAHAATTQVAGEHSHSHGCSHDHSEPVETESVPVDPESPSHPCRCHCEGSGCVAVPGAAWQLDAPQASFDFLPFDCSACENGVATGSRQVDGHGASLALALPLRAHLYFQILLI
jgi:hypothetical protein